MRVSTTQIYTQGIEAFQKQQAKLAKLQQQISTGVRLTRPSDDPAASSRVLQLEQTISLNLQYQVNIGLAEARLELERLAHRVAIMSAVSASPACINASAHASTRGCTSDRSTPASAAMPDSSR